MPAEVAVQTLQVVGKESKVGFTLKLTAWGEAHSGYLCSPTNHTDEQCGGVVSAKFEDNFSDTVTWGGITSVTNAVTGEPILDWKVVSQSGFDYSKPYPVPEPDTFVLLSFAAAVLVHRQRRQKPNI